MMNDTENVPSWEVSVEHKVARELFVWEDGEPDGTATIADLRRAAEACGYELAVAGTTQVSANYVKDVDYLRAERDKYKAEQDERGKDLGLVIGNMEAVIADRDKLKAELEQTKSDLQYHQKQSKDWKEMLDKSNDRMRGVMLELESAMTELEKKRFAFRKLEEAEAVIDDLRAKTQDCMGGCHYVKELTAARDKAEAAAKLAREVNDMNVKKYLEAENELQELRDFKRIWAVGGRIKDELDRVAKDRDEWKAKCHKALDEVSELERLYNEYSKEASNGWGQYHAAKTDLEQVKSQLAQRDNELDNACVRAVAAEKVAGEVQAELEQCKKELGNWEGLRAEYTLHGGDYTTRADVCHWYRSRAIKAEADLANLRKEFEPWNLDRILKDRDDLSKLRTWLSGAKRVWVNEYGPRGFSGSIVRTTEDSAKKEAYPDAIRIAVPFVELSKDVEEVLSK